MIAAVLVLVAAALAWVAASTVVTVRRLQYRVGELERAHDHLRTDVAELELGQTPHLGRGSQRFRGRP